MRMNATQVIVGSGLGKGVAEAVPGIERVGPDVQHRTQDAVRDVVAVGPGDRGAGRDPQRRRGEGEVVDRHLHRCVGAGRRQAGAGGGSKDKQAEKRSPLHRDHPASGVSTMASGESVRTKLALAVPRTWRSSPGGTVIGPGPFAVPGAGCGNAVERAVWNATWPSTFCSTWWMCPFSTVTEPNLRM